MAALLLWCFEASDPYVRLLKALLLLLLAQLGLDCASAACIIPAQAEGSAMD